MSSPEPPPSSVPPPPSDGDADAALATPAPVADPASAETTAPAVAGPASPGHRHTRLIVSIALLVVTLVAAPLFIVAIWVNTQITDTDRYVSTVAPLADDPAVQEYVAAQLADA